MLELSGFVTMAGWDRRQMHVADAAQNTAAMRRDALAEGESQVHGLAVEGRAQHRDVEIEDVVAVLLNVNARLSRSKYLMLRKPSFGG